MRLYEQHFAGAKILLRYLDNNPDRVNEPGITIAIEAFRDAWPCHGGDAESSSGLDHKARARKIKTIESVLLNSSTGLTIRKVRVKLARTLTLNAPRDLQAIQMRMSEMHDAAPPQTNLNL